MGQSPVGQFPLDNIFWDSLLWITFSGTASYRTVSYGIAFSRITSISLRKKEGRRINFSCILTYVYSLRHSNKLCRSSLASFT